MTESHLKKLGIWRAENGVAAADNVSGVGYGEDDTYSHYSSPMKTGSNNNNYYYSNLLEAIKESKAKQIIKEEPRTSKSAIDPNYITYDKFIKTLDGGARKSHVPIHNHSLEWNDGQVHCIACGYVRIGQLKNLYRHTILESHVKNFRVASGTNFPICQVEAVETNAAVLDSREADADEKLELRKHETEIDPTADKNYISYERFMAQLSGGKHKAHVPIIKFGY